jgi:hypothetical protein
MGRDAILQLQKLGKPRRFAFPVENDILVALGPGDCRTEGSVLTGISLVGTGREPVGVYTYDPKTQYVSFDP